MANVLIMGCGYISTHLGMLLARNGHSVWGAKRKVEFLPPEIHPVTVDVMHLTDADLPEALDYIFYMVSPDAYSDEAYRTAYEHGVRNLLFALQKAHQKPTRIIMVSSTGVYGQQTGEWVDETSPTEPMDFAGFRVLMGEETFLDSIFTVSVVRLGGAADQHVLGAVDVIDEAILVDHRELSPVLNQPSMKVSFVAFSFCQ